MPLGRYGFRAKRPRQFYGGNRAKRSRREGRRGLPGRNMFINQLGGWSSNRKTNTKGRIIEITGTQSAYTIEMQAGRVIGTTLVPFSPSNNTFGGQNIYPKYQKWKLQKLEFFFKPLNVTPTATISRSIGQLSISKWRDRQDPSNILNVGGCQTKMMTVTNNDSGQDQNSEIDLIRCACFNPPVSIDGLNTARTSGNFSYLINPWMDGESWQQASFNAFALQWTLGSPSSDSFSVNGVGYFKATWIAKNPSFEQI